MNVSYILWVAAFNTSFLLGYLAVLDIWIYALPRERSTAKKGSMLGNAASPSSLPASQQAAVVARGNPPLLLEAVNRHSLTVFLLVRVVLFPGGEARR